MDFIDGSEHVAEKNIEQSPSLLTIILDTNPAAWSLLSDVLPLSSVVANVLVFINAHLACNYTNKVAVIASHCDKAQYLYPTPSEQLPPQSSPPKRQPYDEADTEPTPSHPSKRARPTGSQPNGTTTNSPSSSIGNKYRPFRLIESELLTNLTTLLTSTSPSSLKTSTSTMIAGALTLCLSYINRESILYSESLTGVTRTANQSTPRAQTSPSDDHNKLQSRILLLTASPSTDLAHQYIPIMNAIFACQRLGIPIDILSFPLPSSKPSSTSTSTTTFDATATTIPPTQDSSTSTVFLQQASDATNGIFIPFQYPSSSPKLPHTAAQKQTQNPTPTTTLSSQALLTYLLQSLLPSPSLRRHLILPTRIDVDFRAACFCHRRVIDIGYVCSICLSIFCEPPEGGECLTCGNQLVVSGKGSGSGRPVVVARKRDGKMKKKKKKKKKKRLGDAAGGGGEGSSRVGTPTAS